MIRHNRGSFPYIISPMAIITLLLLTGLNYLSAEKSINDDNLSKSDILIGNFNVEDHQDFSILPQRISIRKIYLRKDALQAFLKLEQDARRDGITLKVISGFRSYQHQKNIWNNKFKSYSHAYPNISSRVDQILMYSAIPGVSRHHWGTDLDINALNNNYFLGKNGKKVHEWMKENAEKYGFYLTYTFGRNGGYQPEMWHYTYYPSSSKMMKDFYLYITPETLPDFKGYNSIEIDKIFYEYSFNINPTILDKLRIDDISIILTY